MRWRTILTAALFIVANGSFAWQQWLVGRAVTDVQRGHAVVRVANGQIDYSVALHWLEVLSAVALIRAVLQYVAGASAQIIGQQLMVTIRERIFAQAQRLDLAYHWKHGAGELLTRTTRDSDKVRDALVIFWRQVVDTSTVAIASVGILFWYSPWLGIVPLLLTVAAIAVLIPQTDRLVLLDRAVGARYDAVSQDLIESVNGVRVIKSFGLEATRIGAFEEQVAAFAVDARAALRFAAQKIPIPQFIVALSYVWVLAYGSRLVGEGNLTVGALVASLLTVNALVLRFEGVGSVMQTFADARSSAVRIWDLLDESPTIISGERTLPKGPLGVKFDGVRVATPDGGNDILKDVSFEIRPGEIVALVGNTGSGKSTLMGLLPRLFSTDAGAVSVGSDEAGWHDVRSLQLKDLRDRVHVLPQESFLFSESLAANLRLTAPAAHDDDLFHALGRSAAEDVLSGLPDGLDARIGDKGVTLSGGQRQRVCLARGILSGASVLGFDDSTSALDAATERIVLENIRELRSDSTRATTLLIVTNRLSTILMADRVLLLGGGKIAAQGSHEELSASSSAYRDLMGI